MKFKNYEFSAKFNCESHFMFMNLINVLLHACIRINCRWYYYTYVQLLIYSHCYNTFSLELLSLTSYQERASRSLELWGLETLPQDYSSALSSQRMLSCWKSNLQLSLQRCRQYWQCTIRSISHIQRRQYQLDLCSCFYRSKSYKKEMNKLASQPDTVI